MIEHVNDKCGGKSKLSQAGIKLFCSTKSTMNNKIRGDFLDPVGLSLASQQSNKRNLQKHHFKTIGHLRVPKTLTFKLRL